jgi:GDP-4-dehydro-6-deoxy-D-mannose reductase
MAQHGYPGTIWNVGSGAVISMNDVVRHLPKLSGTTLTTEIRAGKAPPKMRMGAAGNIPKIRRALGWAPEIPTKRMLKGLLDYWIERERHLR